MNISALTAENLQFDIFVMPKEVEVAREVRSLQRFALNGR